MGADVYPTAFSVPRWSGKPTHSFGCCATQSAPIIIRFRGGSKCGKAFSPGAAEGVFRPRRAGTETRTAADTNTMSRHGLGDIGDVSEILSRPADDARG